MSAASVVRILAQSQTVITLALSMVILMSAASVVVTLVVKNKSQTAIT